MSPPTLIALGAAAMLAYLLVLTGVAVLVCRWVAKRDEERDA